MRLQYPPAHRRGAAGYAYRLEGVDNDWVYPEEGKNSAFYTNLGKGKYVFKVKATDKNGNKGRVGHELVGHFDHGHVMADGVEVNSCLYTNLSAADYCKVFSTSVLLSFLRLLRPDMEISVISCSTIRAGSFCFSTSLSLRIKCLSRQ